MPSLPTAEFTASDLTCIEAAPAIAENLFQKPSLLHVVRNDYPYEFIPTLTMCLWSPLEFDLQVYIDYKSRNLYIKSIKTTPFVTYSP